MLRPIPSILFDQSLNMEEGGSPTGSKKVDRQAGYLVGTQLAMQARG